MEGLWRILSTKYSVNCYFDMEFSVNQNAQGGDDIPSLNYHFLYEKDVFSLNISGSLEK